jgi:acetyl-CoA carboxylase carboxyl transferase subunit beta
MRSLFRRAAPGTPGGERGDKDIPEDVWVRCPSCREMIYSREWEAGFKVCAKCGYHTRLGVRERVALLLDPDSFEELDGGMRSGDPLRFAPEGIQPYGEKLKSQAAETGLLEAAVYGRGGLDGLPVVLAIMDFSFIGASMGSVVGEKIARAAEVARRERRPLIICSASGGARQHEGIIALMQMAKTVAAIKALGRARLPYISIMTDPTTAGVTASFAALGDCILAEPGAVIGFAGPRVVEQTIREKLPPGVDTAEFQQRHGMIDMVVPRRDLRAATARMIRFFQDAVASTREVPAGAESGAESGGNGRPAPEPALAVTVAG